MMEVTDTLNPYNFCTSQLTGDFLFFTSFHVLYETKVIPDVEVEVV